MNIQEAKEVLAEKLSEYRKLTYEQLASKVDQRSDHFELTGTSGVMYQVVVRMVWDDKEGKDVRVLGSIDDGGWRSFFPLTDSFIVAPNATSDVRRF